MFKYVIFWLITAKFVVFVDLLFCLKSKSQTERDFVEDVELKIMSETLHRCIDLLTPKEKELIQALYFQGLSERDYAEFEGVSQNAIHKRKKRILAKLKKFIEK